MMAKSPRPAGSPPTSESSAKDRPQGRVYAFDRPFLDQGPVRHLIDARLAVDRFRQQASEMPHVRGSGLDAVRGVRKGRFREVSASPFERSAAGLHLEERLDRPEAGDRLPRSPIFVPDHRRSGPDRPIRPRGV